MADDTLTGFPRLAGLLETELRDGTETGVQLSVAHRGRTYEIAVGDNGAGSPMTTGTFVPWTCSSKPIGALAFAQAWDKGIVGIEDPVANYLPEYGSGGKSGVRVRDLLTHTTGVPDPLMNVDPEGTGSMPWEEIDALAWSVICAAEAERRPGTAMLYNPITNWFTLDRVLTAACQGRPGDSYRSLFPVLGISATLGLGQGLGAGQRVQIAAAPDEMAGLERMRIAAELPLPGTGVWGPVKDLRAVGEVLLAGGSAGGAQIVSRSAVEAMTATHWPGPARRGVVSTIDFPYGLGFMTLPHLLGRECSFRTYGHAGGNTSSLLVDPVAEIVIAVYWNGRLSDVKTVERRHCLVTAIYSDLRIPAVNAAPKK